MAGLLQALEPILSLSQFLGVFPIRVLDGSLERSLILEIYTCVLVVFQLANEFFLGFTSVAEFSFSLFALLSTFSFFGNYYITLCTIFKERHYFRQQLINMNGFFNGYLNTRPVLQIFREVNAAIIIVMVILSTFYAIYGYFIMRPADVSWFWVILRIFFSALQLMASQLICAQHLWYIILVGLGFSTANALILDSNHSGILKIRFDILLTADDLLKDFAVKVDKIFFVFVHLTVGHFFLGWLCFAILCSSLNFRTFRVVVGVWLSQCCVHFFALLVASNYAKNQVSSFI